MIKKYLKLTLISTIAGFVFSFLFVEYFYANIKTELKNYEQTKFQLQVLGDSYALCVGLYNANPSKEKEQLCKYIKEKVFLELDDIENKYPYTTFYNKVFGE